MLKFKHFLIECLNTKHTSIHYTFHNSLQCSLTEEPFCDVQEFLPLSALGGREGGANSSCTYDRLAIAACILADVTLFNLSIPIQYQVWGLHVYNVARMYTCTDKQAHTPIATHRQVHTDAHTFTHTLLTLQYFSDPNLGGIAETLDFCPINFVSDYIHNHCICWCSLLHQL